MSGRAPVITPVRPLPLEEPHRVSTSGEARGAPAKVPPARRQPRGLERATTASASSEERSPTEVGRSQAPEPTPNAAAPPGGDACRRGEPPREHATGFHSSGPRQVGRGLRAGWERGGRGRERRPQKQAEPEPSSSYSVPWQCGGRSPFPEAGTCLSPN